MAVFSITDTEYCVSTESEGNPSQIPSKENVVIAEAVWRSGLSSLESSEGYLLTGLIFQLADHFLFLRKGKKKKFPLVLLRKTKLHPCDRSNCHLAAQHSTRARSSFSHREADAGKNGMDKTKEKGQN